MEDDIWAVKESGRFYQGLQPGEYLLPNDDEEQDRLDFIHAAYRLIIDGNLTTVPFKTPPQRVLDIGTGTGIWPIEFAEMCPDSEVFGIDLFPMQPEEPPQNCHWIIGNVETQGGWWDKEYDYIHMRSIGPCFKNIETVLENCFRALQPGGWIEIQDGVWKPGCVDHTMDGTAIPEFFQALCAGTAKAGFDMLKAARLKNDLKRIGFTDIVEEIIDIPGSPWTNNAKMNRIGMYLGRSLQETKESYDKVLGPNGEELKRRFMKDLKRHDIHWYIPVYFIRGRKPFQS